ncbi:MAG: ketoacyl-ACP synthase III [Rhodocyclaceae bacterium]|nr:ketoacyl-ACP synthase III [Rhodocyclaceae bacterium]
MSTTTMIRATGTYLPERVVLNGDFTQFPSASLPMIEEKTGVRARRYAAADECTSDMAAKAGRVCLDRAGLDPAQVEGIILATSSPDRVQPATATRAQHLLGATDAFACDVNSVCTGSVYAVALASAMISSGFCRNVLVIASELYSRILNPADFSTYPYFGDGAGACLLCAAGEGRGVVVDTVLHSDGSGADIIQVPAGGSMMPYAAMKQSKDLYFKMKGKEVFQFAVNRGAEVIDQLCAKAGVAKTDLAWVVPHQANINIIRELSQRTGIDRGKFYVNLERYGNTAGASVLIALDELWNGGSVRPGDLIMVVAFGGGLSWGASLIRY